MCRLPPPGGIRVQVPLQCMIAVARQLLRSIIRKSHWPPHIQAYMIRRTLIIVGRGRTFLSMSRPAGLAAQMSVPELAAVPTHLMEHAASGRGMQHVNRRWDIPVRLDLHELWTTTTDVVAAWAVRWLGARSARWLLDRQPRLHTPAFAHPSFVAQWQHWQPSMLAYHLHTWPMEGVLSKPPHSKENNLLAEHCVPDDKNKKTCWRLPKLTYYMFMIKYVTNSPKWRFSTLTQVEADEKIKVAIQAMVPPRLHRSLQISAKTPRLPSMYVTSKSKCHDPSANRLGHTCSKEGHSCCRKVISFTSWPRRKSWRDVGTALETVT